MKTIEQSPVSDVLILNGHTGIRALVRSMVVGMNGIRLAGESADAQSAGRLLEAQTCGSIIIADPLLPPFGIMGLIQEARRSAISHQFVLYCGANPPNVLVHQCLQLKVSLISGDDPLDELHAAILAAATNSEPIYSDSIRQRIEVNEQGQLGVPLLTCLKAITPKRLSVLLLIAQGYSVKQAAFALGLSEKSVDSHLSRLHKSLGIHNRVELAMFCIREGLISVPQSPDVPRPVSQPHFELLGTVGPTAENENGGEVAAVPASFGTAATSS